MNIQSIPNAASLPAMQSPAMPVASIGTAPQVQFGGLKDTFKRMLGQSKIAPNPENMGSKKKHTKRLVKASLYGAFGALLTGTIILAPIGVPLLAFAARNGYDLAKRKP